MREGLQERKQPVAHRAEKDCKSNQSIHHNQTWVCHNQNDEKINVFGKTVDQKKLQLFIYNHSSKTQASVFNKLFHNEPIFFKLK